MSSICQNEDAFYFKASKFGYFTRNSNWEDKNAACKGNMRVWHDITHILNIVF